MERCYRSIWTVDQLTTVFVCVFDSDTITNIRSSQTAWILEYLEIVAENIGEIHQIMYPQINLKQLKRVGLGAIHWENAAQ